jgi:hypothetical protein
MAATIVADFWKPSTGMSQILLLDKIFHMDGICPTGLVILRA